MGRSLCTLLRQEAVSPNHVPENKNKKACLLWMGCERLASASEYNVRELGARAGISRGYVCPTPVSD